jgi:hypothetical protein
VSGHGAEAQPVRVDPLDVDGRQRSLEFAGNLQRNRDAAAGHTNDHRLIQLERGDGLRQDAAGGNAIAEERRARDETHALIVPGRSSGESGIGRPFAVALPPKGDSSASSTLGTLVRLLGDRAHVLLEGAALAFSRRDPGVPGSAAAGSSSLAFRLLW